jgi:phthiodiolone/phenolphthiodiolone dimycocerosates ketoreductase
MKKMLEAAGRDPEAFGFGMWLICLMHDDDSVIDAVMANDYIRWISGTMGRFNPAAWRDEGVEPPMGDSWHYAVHMLPLSYSEQETADVLARATPEVVRRSWHRGSPQQLAEAVSPYIDAGVNFVQIVDFVPIARPADEAPDGLRRAIELAGLIKQRHPTG